MVKTSEDVAVVGAEIPAILKQSINKMKATAITNEDAAVVGGGMAPRHRRACRRGRRARGSPGPGGRRAAGCPQTVRRRAAALATRRHFYPTQK